MRIERAIVYARVSKDDGKRGRSCKEQVDANTSDCEYEGWTIAEIIQDNDRGASRHSKREREGFARLQQILRAGDVLVVWEPSRVTRDMREFGDFCDLLAERRVLLYYDGRTYDMEDDDDRNRVWQDILDGAKQVGKTRKRVMRAMDANVKDRKPHGKRPPGYDIVYRDGESEGWVVNPRQQLVLKKAAQRVLDEGPAVSMRALSEELAVDWNAAGGRGAFASRDITRFLTSPTTFGFRIHESEVVGKGTWDPVLDPDWYRPLRAVLKDVNRLTHRGSEPRWLLSYIARCGVCLELGEPGIIDRKGPRSSRHVDSYVCRTHNHVARNMERVNDHVEELLLRLLEAPETLVKLNVAEAVGQRTIDEEMGSLERLRADRKAYIRKAARTRMSAESVAEYVEELEAQIRETQSRIDVVSNAIDPVLAGIAGPNAREDWVAYGIEDKRDVIRRALSVTIVRVERRGRYSSLGVEVRPLV